jgi:hypothetical protein
MFQFFSDKSRQNISFEDMQNAIKQHNKYTILNTLPSSSQDVLIKRTLPMHDEERFINDIIDNYEMSKHNIIIYGNNCNDNSVDTKYNQLHKLGFSSLYVYLGGMFEWTMLQDIYGKDEFPTDGYTLDILQYKPRTLL